MPLRSPRRCRAVSVFGCGLLLAGVAGLSGNAEPEPSDLTPPKRAADGDKERQATVALVLDQALVGRLLNESLTVRTRYGVLVVPVEEVVRIRMRPTLSPEDTARLEALTAELASPTTDPREEAILEEIRRLGVPAYHALVAAREQADESLEEKLETLIEEIRSIEDVYLEDTDEVMTRRFTMRGTITEEAFGFGAVPGGSITVPRTDVIQIAYRKLEIRESWKVGPQHMERQGFLDTGFKLRRKQKFSLAPSGTMTYNGRAYGPGGLSNHRWNSRNLGCLQWRVGGGAWKILGAPFEGRAETSGTLQLSVHLYNSNASGEFKVELKTRRK